MPDLVKICHIPDLVKINEIFLLKITRSKRTTQNMLSSCCPGSYRAVITKGNPIQAINLMNLNATFQRDQANGTHQSITCIK